MEERSHRMQVYKGTTLISGWSRGGRGKIEKTKTKQKKNCYVCPNGTWQACSRALRKIKTLPTVKLMPLLTPERNNNDKYSRKETRDDSTSGSTVNNICKVKENTVLFCFLI